MAMEQHLETLRDKHTSLDELVRLEESRPLPNAAYVHQLKKEKLRIKDQLKQLETATA